MLTLLFKNMFYLFTGIAYNDSKTDLKHMHGLKIYIQNTVR